MRVYCVFETDNDCPTDSEGDESFYEWEELKHIFSTEKKANDWISKQELRSFLNIKVFEIE